MTSWERSEFEDKINKLITEGYPTDKSPVKDMIEEYLKKNLEKYAVFNDSTWKWEITFDELVEMLEKYEEQSK